MTPNILRAIAAPTPPGQLLFNSFRVPRYGRLPLIFKPQTRNLSIHEYQAQGLLAKAGINVPCGRVAETPEAARDAAASLGGPCILKAQVLAGGRGKGVFDSGLKGGVQLVETSSAQTAFDMSKQMIGSRLRTKQTSEKGLEVGKVYVAEKAKYDKEFYLSIAVDRDNTRPAIIASRIGGVDIEALAARDDNSVVRIPLDYHSGVTGEVSAQVAKVAIYS